MGEQAGEQQKSPETASGAPDTPSASSTLSAPSPSSPSSPSSPPSPTAAPERAQAQRIKEVGGFELLSKIGQGGMGAVFLARQKSLDRVVALKILPPSVAKDATFIERFQREARASAKLNHPNIVQGIDVGRDEAAGLWYFAMEYVDGPNLRQVLKEQKVIPEERALTIAREMAGALECAARNGIVHRDIKPDNILLTKQGQAKLADLGLAKQMSSDDPSVTQSGQSVGTPFYMAPEQARGASGEIDIRTDIYALGATLFHLVTGQTPFNGDTSAVIMTKQITEPAPRANRVNPAVSEACTRLILRMMQKKREQRFQTPQELVAQIEKVLRHEEMPEPQRPALAPRTAVRRAEPAPEKRSAAKPLLSAAALAVVVVLAALLLRGKPQKAAVGPAAPPAGTEASSAGRSRSAVSEGQPKTERPAVKAPLAVAETKTGPAALPAPAAAARPTGPAGGPEARTAPQPPPATVPALEDTRETFAQHLVDDLQAEEKGGKIPLGELRYRYEQIARNHGQTKAGKEAAEKLKTLPEPPPEPYRPPVLAFSLDRATLGKEDEKVTVSDLSGGKKTGVAAGAKSVPGIVGEALHFDGKESCVTVSAPPKLGPALTVAVWVNYDNVPEERWNNAIICQDNGEGARVFQLSTRDGKFCWFRFRTGANACGKDPIEAKRWYHVAAVYDSMRHEHRLYVDGALCDQAAGSLMPSDTEPIVIGRCGTSERPMFFAGSIDEVAIWSQALPETKIRELYETSKKGLSYCQPGAAAAQAAAGEQPAPKPEAPAGAATPAAGAAVPPADTSVRDSKAEELFAGVFKECAPALVQGRFSDALTLLERKAGDHALADAREWLKQEKSDLEAVRNLRRQAVEALCKMAGKTVTLNKPGLSGRIKDDPKHENVTLQVSDGPLLTVHSDQLPPQDVDLYAPHLPEKGEDERLRGVLFLAAGDAKTAKDFFTKARKDGAGAAFEPQRDWVLALETAEMEVAARKAWEDAERSFAVPAFWPAAEASYAAFQQKYGKTRTFARNAGTLKQHLETIESSKKPKITFIAEDSMKLFEVGHREMQFPIQEADDATGPFQNKAVYFRQMGATAVNVFYEVHSGRAFRQLRWKGAAMERMVIEIQDLKGKVLDRGGPYEGGNKWAEYTMDFEQPRKEFRIRFCNHVSTWYLIAELELK
ncbi:MAG: protein kinase [Planctomycetota bacterium]